MKRISAKEVLKEYIDKKSCVVVYPKTDWMREERDEIKIGVKTNAMLDKLKLRREADPFQLIDNDYFVFEFEDRVEAEKFFFSFDKFTFDLEEPFYVQLYIKGEFEGENT